MSLVKSNSTTATLDRATQMTPCLSSNFPAGVPACAPVAQKVMRGEWVIAGVTWGCYPNQARALGTTAAHMGDLVPFETKRKATAAWLAIHHAPKAFSVGQAVWLYTHTHRKPYRVPAQVVTCSYTHAVVLRSHLGMAVTQRVLLKQIQARESEVA